MPEGQAASGAGSDPRWRGTQSLTTRQVFDHLPRREVSRRLTAAALLRTPVAPRVHMDIRPNRESRNAGTDRPARSPQSPRGGRCPLRGLMKAPAPLPTPAVQPVRTDRRAQDHRYFRTASGTSRRTDRHKITSTPRPPLQTRGRRLHRHPPHDRAGAPCRRATRLRTDPHRPGPLPDGPGHHPLSNLPWAGKESLLCLSS